MVRFAASITAQAAIGAGFPLCDTPWTPNRTINAAIPPHRSCRQRFRQNHAPTTRFPEAVDQADDGFLKRRSGFETLPHAGSGIAVILIFRAQDAFHLSGETPRHRGVNRFLQSCRQAAWSIGDARNRALFQPV
jgi:hypothetical protein